MSPRPLRKTRSSSNCEASGFGVATPCTARERTGGFHRIDPPDANRQPMPERVLPMLAQLGDLPADPERYGFEVKWDGLRVLAYWRPGRLRLQTRNLADVTLRWPDVR